MTLELAREGLTLLVVGTVFASFLIPTSILLFHFSPATVWRSPLFLLNVLAIIMGLAEQTLYIYVIINTTVLKGVSTSLIIVIVAMEFLVPICVQGILLVRVLSVYPPTQNTRKQNLAIYVPMAAFKIARLINAAAAQFVWGTKYVKVEWFLQLFDDMFVSGLFIHKLYISVMTRNRADADASHSGSGTSSSLAQRLRTLYYIAVSNFVFPILFNIAEIAIVFYDPNFFHGATVVTVNCYVTIIGVILATIWAHGSKREKPEYYTTAVLTSVAFARSHEMLSEDNDEDELAQPMPTNIPAMRRGRGTRSPSSYDGKHVVAERVGGSAAAHHVDEEFKEKRVSEPSPSSGTTAGLEPGGVEVRSNAACRDNDEEYTSVLPSATVRGLGASVAHDLLSNAV